MISHLMTERQYGLWKKRLQCVPCGSYTWQRREIMILRGRLMSGTGCREARVEGRRNVYQARKRHEVLGAFKIVVLKRF